MAIITALVTATRVLASQGVKKAAVSGAKGLVKKKAKSFITGKGKKKTSAIEKRGKGRGYYTSEPGALVRTQSSGVSPFIEGVSKSPSSQQESTNTEGKRTVEEQLNSILGLTKTIDGIVKTQYSNQKKATKKAREFDEKEKKRETEKKRESIVGGIGKGILGAANNAGNKFGIFNYLTNILLGGLVVGILKNYKKITSAFEFLTESVGGVINGIKLFALTFVHLKPVLKGALKKVTGLLGKSTSLIKKGFGSIGKAFSSIFKKLPNVIIRTVDAVKDFAKNTVKAIRRGLTFDTRGSELGKTSGATKRSAARTSGAGTRGVPITTDDVNKIRRDYGNTAADFYQNERARGVTGPRAKLNLERRIKEGKIVKSPMRGRLSGAISGSQVVKGGLGRTASRSVIKLTGKKGAGLLQAGAKLAKGAKGILGRIPILGPLIVGIASFIETGKLDQALFRAGGALIGGLLGTFIPIPVIGTMFGELVGEYVGDLFYTLIKGGGMEAVNKRLKNDLTHLLTAGKKAAEWAGNGLKEFYKGVPKFKLPTLPTYLGVDLNTIAYGPLNAIIKNMTGTGIQDIEFPNPIWWMNPTNIGEKMTLFQESFFGGDVKEGEVSETEPVKLKGQSRQIAEDEMYLQEGVGYFDSKTQRFLGKTREESEGVLLSREQGLPDSEKAVPTGTADDAHGHGSPVPSSDKLPFEPGSGDKSRRIFLHWTAGSHSQSYDAYHTTFLGSGKAVRSTPYGQDKGGHTAGANTNSVGLSLAAMGGAGVDETNFGSFAPTNSQIDAMVTEAAQLAIAWGWDAATVDKNVRTHGEWERYAVKNGLLKPPVQRWDLDKLRESDPNIDTSKVLSAGGTKLRNMIKSKMRNLKGDSPSGEVKKPTKSSSEPVVTPPKESESYIQDVSATEAKVDETESSTKPPKNTQVKMKRHWNEVAIGKNKGKGSYGIDSPDTFPSEPTAPQQKESSQVQMSSQSRPSTSGIEKQAYYDDPEQGSTSVIAIPPNAPAKSGNNGSSSSVSFGGSRKSMLNSYYKEQILGSLYKQG